MSFFLGILCHHSKDTSSNYFYCYSMLGFSRSKNKLYSPKVCINLHSMDNDISLMRKAEANCSLTNICFILRWRLAQKYPRNCLLFEACPTLVACLIQGCFHCSIEVIQGVVSWIPVFTDNEVSIYVQFRAKQQQLNFLLNVFVSSGKQSC